MELSTILGILGVIASPLYDAIKSLAPPALNRTYEKALKKWAPNEGARKYHSQRYHSTLEQLAKFVTEKKENLSSGEIELLQSWNDEIIKDADAYNFVDQIISKEIIKIASLTLNRVEGLSKQSHEEHQEILSEVKGSKQQSHEEHQEILSKLEELKEVTISINQPHKIIVSNNSQVIYEEKYLPLSLYIPRKIKDYQTFDIMDNYLHPGNYNPQPFSKFIVDGNKRILLYSDPQSGKTTELKNLAYELQNSGLYSVVLFELKDYLGYGSLESQLNLSQRFQQYNGYNVLILDGLDELKDEFRSIIIKELRFLSKKYNQDYFIVSCRSNYERTNNIDGFKKLYLKQLSPNDITQYIDKNCKQPDIFNRLINEKKLDDLAFNPFYLQSLISYYNDNHTLPETKAEIYDYVIKKSFDIDQQRISEVDTITMKVKGYDFLEKIAFCLQITERQSFNEKEIINELGITDEQLRLCIRYTIFKRDENGNYAFQHNAFKEYMVAKKISSMKFEDLKTILCYDGTNILRPSLYNVVTILVGLLDSQSELFTQLINWLSEHKPEILFVSEKHLLSSERCYEIFKAYYEKIKHDHIFIDLQHRKKIIRFANSKETIKYLIDEVKSEVSLSRNLINALTLLRYSNLFLLSEVELADYEQLILDCLAKYVDEKDKGYEIFYPFKNEHFLNVSYVSRIFEIIKDSTSPTILNSFFNLLKAMNLGDDYCDWLISKKQCIKNYTTRDGVNHSVSKDHYYTLLATCNNPNNICNILSQFYQQYFYDDMDGTENVDFKKTLIDNLKEKSFENISIAEEVAKIIENEKLSSYSFTKNETEIIAVYNSFFTEMNVDQNIFDKYYNLIKDLDIEGSKNTQLFEKYINVITTVIDIERIQFIINDKELDINKKEWMFRYFQSYQNVNNDLEIRQLIDDFLPKPLIREHQKEEQEQFNILFDYDKFSIQVKQISENYPGLETVWDNYRKLTNDGFNKSVIDYIFRFFISQEEKGIDKEAALASITNKDFFKSYSLKIILQSIKQNKSLAISERQKEQIYEWVIDTFNNKNNYPDFNTAIRLLVYFEFEIDDSLLIGLMVHADFKVLDPKIDDLWDWNTPEWKTTLLFYIHNKITNKSLIRGYIENLLKSGTVLRDSYYHILAEYIVENKIQTCYRYLISILKDSPEKYSTSIKLKLIKEILKLDDSGIQLLKDIEDKLGIEELLFFYELIIKDNLIISGLDKESIMKKIEDIYPLTNINLREQALRLLLECGSEKGLDWCIEYIKNKPTPFGLIFPSFLSYNSNYTDKMFTVLKLKMKEHDGWNNDAAGAAMNALQAMAMESEDSRDNITSKLKEMASSDPENLAILTYRANEMFKKYYEVNHPADSIKEAKDLYDILD